VVQLNYLSKFKWINVLGHSKQVSTRKLARLALVCGTLLFIAACGLVGLSVAAAIDSAESHPFSDSTMIFGGSEGYYPNAKPDRNSEK
jgi:hypothetical protein